MDGWMDGWIDRWMDAAIQTSEENAVIRCAM